MKNKQPITIREAKRNARRHAEWLEKAPAHSTAEVLRKRKEAWLLIRDKLANGEIVTERPNI